jgi:hypothetical protein
VKRGEGNVVAAELVGVIVATGLNYVDLAWMSLSDVQTLAGRNRHQLT